MVRVFFLASFLAAFFVAMSGGSLFAGEATDTGPTHFKKEPSPEISTLARLIKASSKIGTQESKLSGDKQKSSLKSSHSASKKLTGKKYGSSKKTAYKKSKASKKSSIRKTSSGSTPSVDKKSAKKPSLRAKKI